MSYFGQKSSNRRKIFSITPMLPTDAVDMVFERNTSLEVTVLVSVTPLHPGAGFSFTQVLLTIILYQMILRT